MASDQVLFSGANTDEMQATIHKAPDRSGAKSASAALEAMIKKNNAAVVGKDPRKTKSAKSSSKKKKGKGKKAKKKPKVPPVSFEQLKTPAAMKNAYYICHNAPDFLHVRGFKFKPKSAWETVPAAIKLRILGYC